MQQQIIISGVGGQGVLFITRLLAEAAIAVDSPVVTSETHGMAQRGGTVLSHLKVGDYASPLIRPGQADGMLVLRSENLLVHQAYLKPDGWAVINSPAPEADDSEAPRFFTDADRLALAAGLPRSVNLILLGVAMGLDATGLFCGLGDLKNARDRRFAEQPKMRDAALNAIALGVDASAGSV
jgi:indolepyruvate ferredoxin oxidoreductase, beta subunit